MKPWYEIKNVAAGRADIWIYEEIGEDIWGEGIVAKQLVRDLAALDVAEIDVHINSPGGNIFDGEAIYNALRRHPAQVTTYIDGLAASIASVIALAGDRVVMAVNALIMIHDPFGYAVGNATELRQYAEVLDKIAGTIAAVYVAKSTMDEAEIRAAMLAETWMDAEEAQSFGFIDEITEALAVAARFDLSRFHNAPPAVLPADATGDSGQESPDALAGQATAPARGRIFVPAAHRVIHYQEES